MQREWYRNGRVQQREKRPCVKEKRAWQAHSRAPTGPASSDEARAGRAASASSASPSDSESAAIASRSVFTRLDAVLSALVSRRSRGDAAGAGEEGAEVSADGGAEVGEVGEVGGEGLTEGGAGVSLGAAAVMVDEGSSGAIDEDADESALACCTTRGGIRSTNGSPETFDVFATGGRSPSRSALRLACGTWRSALAEGGSGASTSAAGTGGIGALGAAGGAGAGSGDAHAWHSDAPPHAQCTTISGTANATDFFGPLRRPTRFRLDTVTVAAMYGVPVTVRGADAFSASSIAFLTDAIVGGSGCARRVSSLHNVGKGGGGQR